MRINIDAALKNAGKQLAVSFLEDAGTWDDPLKYSFAGPVGLEGGCKFDGGFFIVEGKISARLNVACDYCLKPFVYEISFPFEDVFTKTPDEENGEYGYTGEELVLNKMVLDEISLNMPVGFVCREGCKGLCPICGADRNVTKCGCETDETRTDNPFDKLQGLFD